MNEKNSQPLSELLDYYALKLIRANKATLADFPQHQDDPDFIFDATKHDPKNLIFAKYNSINLNHFFQKIIKYQPSALIYAPDSIKNDINFFLDNIESCPYIF